MSSSQTLHHDAIQKDHLLNRIDSGQKKNCQQKQKEPWAIDRVGRFILGIILLFVSLGIIYISSYFVILLLLSGTNLAITSITNKCAFNKFLKKFGFKEREEIYEPGGQVKNQKD